MKANLTSVQNVKTTYSLQKERVEGLVHQDMDHLQANALSVKEIV